MLLQHAVETGSTLAIRTFNGTWHYAALKKDNRAANGSYVVRNKHEQDYATCPARDMTYVR